ncbi:MAG: MBL fold metallo-hydrolase [Verrucomicrobia bacterium]|nr:MBL fold metallo-hydrolase [Verrucomicrobiota bacterium]MDA1087309.1 MBL fold metallo-hydrolase [Verrucomicrobiota bacterium]
MKICVLASSSSANCTYIESGRTRILIDAGLSAKETTVRLASIGVEPGSIQAICVSHEHSDHIAGLRVLHQRHGIPLYANSGTSDAVSSLPRNDCLGWKVFSTGAPFLVGDLRIEPFSVPHDAYEPVGFVISDLTDRVGIVTDMGTATELIRQRLRGCHGLVIETNYDDDLLRDSKRPWPLKQRIMGRQGHLSNQHAAEMIAEILSPQLRRVYLAHLSNDCNRPELAMKAMRDGLNGHAADHLQIVLTHADRPTELWAVDAAG